MTRPADGIAIVGVGLRLPGGVRDLDGLRDQLRSGADPLGPVPTERWDPARWGTPPIGGFVDDPFRFDAAFFGLTESEARDLDPAQRWLLEVAWEALEHAGIPPDGLAGSATGIWVGLGLSDYGRRHLLGADPHRLGPFSGTGTLLSVAAGRVAHTLGLRGPAMVVDTACSSSLVAVDLAVRALREGRVERALVGGANVLLSPMPSVWLRRIGAASADGRCRTFDADADGYGRSEGAAVLVLERLADARAAGRRVLAVVEGSAVGHDGRAQALTAPNGEAQRDVVRAALRDAGRAPEEVDYVEAHGSATRLGDPIEVDALRAAFGEGRRPLFLGSIKTHLGHLETAAGIAGVLSALLVVRDGVAPAHRHLRTPNPRLSLRGFVVPSEPVELPPGPRLAGVSAFGLSGTNAHVLLSTAPEAPPAPRPSRPFELLPFSGPTADHAEATARRWARSSLEPVGASAESALRRATLPWRGIVVGGTGEELRASLTVARARRATRAARVVFAFGAEPPGRGVRLAAVEPLFRDALSAADGDVQLALARTWVALGVVPDHVAVAEGGERSAARFSASYSEELGAHEASSADLWIGLGPEGPDRPTLVTTLRPGEDEARSFLVALGAAWCAGAPVDLRRGRSPEVAGELPSTVFLGGRPELPDPTRADEAPEAGVWVPRWAEAPIGPESGPPARLVRVAGDATAVLRQALAGLREAEAAGQPAVLLGSPDRADDAVLRGLIAVVRRERPDLDARVVLADLAPTGVVDAPIARWDGARAEVPRWMPLPPGGGRVRLDGAVVVTGATGAIGRHLLPWLRDRGARRLILLVRGPGPTPELGIPVERRRVDLTDRAAVAHALADLADLVGVVHAAGRADDAPLAAHDAARIDRVFSPRVVGALALDEATRGRPLAMFLLVSSAAATLGPVGQAAYAAAAARLESLALERRSRGEVATCAAFGPWTVGLGDVDPRLVARWEAEGVDRLPPAAALAGLDRAVDSGEPVVLIAALRPPAAPDAGPSLEAILLEEVRAVLGAGRPLERDTPFFEAGLDSLGALDARDRLQSRLGRSLPPTLLLDHPSVARLARHLRGERSAPSAPLGSGGGTPIELVGRSCRLPGGVDDPGALWAALARGEDTSSEVPADRFDAGWTAALTTIRGGFLADLADFDPESFGMTLPEAEALEPQQRLLLEGTLAALDDAGLAPDRLRDSATGVYVAAQASEYGRRFDPRDPATPIGAATGNAPSFAAGRIAHRFGFRGPALVVDTACSSGLVALAAAVRDLRAGVVRFAVVAGVNTLVGAETSAWMSALGALSPTGRCHTFDRAADGYLRSEGCVVLILRRADDPGEVRAIHARVLGVALGHDGASAGLTVPHGPAQEQVVRAALADGGLDPESVGFVECHGTGTPLGDPIEVRALGEALARGRSEDRPVLLGATKAVVGHTELAAGLVGVLAATLALAHRAVPPIAGLREPNPALPLDEFPALVLPRRATPLAPDALVGVSAFGLSGTNAHVVLGPPPVRSERPRVDAGPWLVPLSAPDSGRLDDLARALADATAPLPDLERTGFLGRSADRRRAVVVAEDHAELRRGLARSAGGASPVDPRVVFLCTGAGPQALGMAERLARTEPAFGAAFERVCAALDRHLDRPLRSVLAAGPDLDDLAWTQPAMFAVTLASAALWRSLGIAPAAVLGHSTGLVAAAHLAGVLDLEAAAALVVGRARLMSTLPADGEMVACFTDEATVSRHLVDGVSLAAVNHAGEAVISGPAARVAEVVAGLVGAGIEVRRLQISHAAHSPATEALRPALHALVASLPMRPPAVPMLDNLRGTFVGAEVTDPAFWTAHLRGPVRFDAAVRTLLAGGHRVFLELGNHPVLAGAVGRVAADLPDLVLAATLRRDTDDRRQFVEAVGALWTAGVPLDLPAFLEGRGGRLTEAPRTPLRRRRCWFDARGGPPHPVSTALDERWTPLRPALSGLGTRGPGTVLVLEDGGGLAATLAGPRGVVVKGDAELDEVLARTRSHTLVLGTALDAFGDPEPSAPRRAFARALSVARAALRHGVRRLVLLTRGASGAGGPVDLGGAGLGGLAATLVVECGELETRWVDLDPASVDPDLLAVAVDQDLERVAVRAGRLWVPSFEPARRPWATHPETTGTTLITGGAGALGRSLAARLRGRGPVVLVGRTPHPELAGDGVSWATADLGEEGAVPRLLAELAARGLPAVTSVWHAAGELADAPIAAADPARVEQCWRGKVSGALALDQSLPDAAPFVLLSSAAATLGSQGQAIYAGANAVLDALARRRHARGGQALSVALGPVAGIGLAAVSGRDWDADGIRPLAAERVWAAVDAALAARVPATTVVDVDWPRWGRRQARVPAALATFAPATAPTADRPGWRASRPDRAREDLEALVGDELARITGRSPEDRGFAEQGLDSLGVVALHRRLRARLGVELPVTLLFEHPTPSALAAALAARLGYPTPASRSQAPAIRDPDAPIAVVSFSLRLPGGVDGPEELWRLLREGRDPVGPVPEDRWDHAALLDPTPGVAGRTTTAEGAFLARATIEGFDAEFFGTSHREAEAMDPQQRLLLELAQEAFERAGVPSEAARGTRGAVFVGIGESGYLDRFRADDDSRPTDGHAGLGHLPAFASGRLAHHFGMLGPNLALNTACSSSLVAVHLACRALRDGEADLALAGGVHLMLSPDHWLIVSHLRALSPGGRCRTFDVDADGYGRAEGGGLFLLARLDEARARGWPVWAVLRGTAVGHDGASSGLGVPSGPAQARVVRAALEASGLTPTDVTFVEAHGTGTALGDPIEVGALADVFAPRPPDRPLWLGAVKSNLGHLEVAAGVASLAKVVLALRHRELPAQLHLRSANPELRLAERGFRLVERPTTWRDDRGPLRCGVSGFGLAGTDAHLVLEEAPPVDPVAPATADRTAHALLVSARTGGALRAVAADVARVLRAGADPGDLAAALATGRTAWERRAVITGRSGPELAERCEALAASADEGVRPRPRPRVVFVCAGQGSQVVGMGAALAHWPPFREVLDRAEAVFAEELGGSLRQALGDEDLLRSTRWTQPALFAHQVGLGRLWASFGVTPELAVGHSVGQLAAATLAGTFSLDDGLRLVAARARALDAAPRGGRMEVVAAGEAQVRAALAGRSDVALAAVNHGAECTVSGDADAVAAVVARLRAEGVRTATLRVSHAFHSPAVETAIPRFAEAFAGISTRPATFPVITNRSGAVADDAELADPGAWASHLRETVRFADGAVTAAARCEGQPLWLELGATGATAALAATAAGGLAIPSQRRDGDPHEQLLAALGALWSHGVPIRWDGVESGFPRRRIDLPTYPFQRRRTWLDLPERGTDGARWLIQERWRPGPIPPSRGGLRVTGDGPLAERLRADLGNPAGDDAVLVVPTATDPDADPVPALSRVAAFLRSPGGGRRVVVTAGASDGASPAAAAVHGLVRAAAAEDPTLRAALVDVVGGEEPTALAAAVRADDEPEAVVSGTERRVRRLTRSDPGPGRPETAVVVISGGTSGIGLRVARHLADHGATALVLIGRSEAGEELRTWLASAPIPVRHLRGDVARPEVAREAVRLARELQPTGPLAVVHAAGVLADRALAGLGEAELRAALAPKVTGAWNLHAATVGEPVVSFVLFSAGAGWLGSPGQGAYAAANAWLDGFARWRRARGLPAVAIAWGAWQEVGMAARLDPSIRARRRDQGVGELTVAAGLGLFLRLRGSAEAVVGALPVDWARWRGDREVRWLDELSPPRDRAAAPSPWRERLRTTGGAERGALLAAEVGSLVRRTLKVATDRTLPADVPLTELGLDSLSALELKNALAARQIDVPIAVLMAGPTLESLTAAVDRAVPESADGPAATDQAPPVHPLVSHGLVFVAGVAFVVLGYAAAAWLGG